jgi:membrane peptidoglycan carboxypeptidase
MLRHSGRLLRIAPWKDPLSRAAESSISQQLAKNLYISEGDRTARDPLRKIQETIFAIELNRRYSKEAILEWYLNEIFYGNFAVGAEAASLRYFGKNANELSLPEAALLAGLPQAPAVYDPLIHFDKAKRRQETVLDLMVRHGYLSLNKPK